MLLLALTIMIEPHVAVPMRDGVKLYADIYRPSAPGKYPTIVVRTPYGVQRDGVHQEMIRFAQNGYAVVMQDVRGRFESEGKWEPFRDEGRDGYDTIEWAAQQPWSTGKVATQGGSYLGNNQWLAGALAPPHLVAMFPRVASTSIYHNWAYFGGVFRLAFNYGWGVVRMPHRIMQPQYWHTEAYAPPELKYDKILLNPPDHGISHYRDWLAHDKYDDYWRAASVEDRFDDIKVPVHTQGGWFDIFLAGTINGYVGMKKRGAKMVIGPWGHGPSRKFGALDFGPTADRKLSEFEDPWFAHYLKGEANGIEKEPPVELFYMGINYWKKEADWPIPGTTYVKMYLGANKSLSYDKTSSASDSFNYDPANPVPTLGGNNCCGSPTVAGPMDQRPLEKRPDVLSYTGIPLARRFAIAGPVKMKLMVSTTAPDMHWMVKLIDVHEDGAAYNIAEGMLRCTGPECEVDLVGTANVFFTGNRIRVDITSSNFPQFARAPHAGKNTVFHGSHIILPVVPLP